MKIGIKGIKTKITFIVLISLFLAGSQAKAVMLKQEDSSLDRKRPLYTNQEKKIPQPEVVPGELIVKFKPQVVQTEAGQNSLSALDGLNSKYGLRSISRVFQGLEVETTTETAQEAQDKYPERAQRRKVDKSVPKLENIFLLKFDEGANILEMVQEYRQHPEVEYAEPNYLIKMQTWNNPPNDPYYHSAGSWGQSEDDL